MLGPLLCGLFSEAPLLPKLRGHFAEFLNNASPVGLGILSPSTCVGFRYGYGLRHSGFSRHPVRVLPYSLSVHLTPPDCAAVFPAALLPRLYRYSLSRHTLPACVPAVLIIRSTGISTCYPSATPHGLALGPDLPRADQLYPGILGHPAGRIPTFLSLLIPAFSLRYGPLPLTVQLHPVSDAPLPACPAACSRASAACFSPGNFRRGTSRLVSCYALFECMAASEPTS